MIELAVNVLATKPAGASHFDTDFMYRAAVLVSIFLNSLKAKGLQLSSTSLNWFALWDSLLKTCEWCSEEKTFQSPGVPELAGLVLGIMEMCLGSSPELWAGPDETERLHAMTMAHMMALERLVRMASASPLGETAKAPTRGRIQLVSSCRCLSMVVLEIMMKDGSKDFKFNLYLDWCQLPKVTLHISCNMQY